MKNGTGGYWSNFDMTVAFSRNYYYLHCISKFYNLLRLGGI